MRRVLFGLVLLILIVPASYASTITFDDLGDGTMSPPTYSYAGLSWNNFSSLTYATYNAALNNHLAPASAPTFIFNAFGNPAATSTSGNPFIFHGASLTGFLKDD